MRRREFISLLSGAAVGWPVAANAQQSAKIARIGYLSTDLAGVLACVRPSAKDCVTSITSRVATS
jgi:hypothetical protein